MADGNYKIRIGSEADTRAIEQTTDTVGRATEAVDQYGESWIKAGVGIDVGGRLVSSVMALPGILKQATTEGVALNAQLQDSQRGIATLLGQFDPNAPADFSARVQMAAKAVDELRQKGLLAEGTFTDLLGAMNASSGSAFAAGIGSLSDQIDLLVASSQVLKMLGGDQAMLGQQLNQILTGNIDPANKLNQVLRFTGAEIKALRVEGKLLDEIMGRFAPTLRDAEEGLEDYSSQLTSWEEQLDNLKIALAAPVFEALTEGLGELNELLDDPKTLDALRAIGVEVAGLVKAGTSLTKWAIENADFLLMVANSAKTLAVAFAAVKVKDLLVGLGSMTKGLFTARAAIDAETASLARNTAAQAANAASRNALAAGAVAGSGRRQLGAPYSPDAYRAARAGGASATDALAQARRAMFLATQETAKLNTVFARVGHGMSNFQRNITELDRAMGGLLKGMSMVLSVQAGWEVGKFAGQTARASRDYGAGLTTQGSIERSEKALEHYGAVIEGFFERAGNLQTAEDRRVLMTDLADQGSALRGKRADLNPWDGAERKVLSNLIEQMDTLFEVVRQLDYREVGSAANALAARERNARTADARAAGESYLEEGRNRRAESLQGDRDRASVEAGDVAALDSRLAEMRSELQQARQPLNLAADEDSAIAAAKVVDGIEDQIAALVKLREEAVRTRAELQQKSDEEAEARGEENDAAAIQKLQDEISFIEAEGALRLQGIEQARLSEEDLAAERNAIEDETAAKRLEKLLQIATLEKASAQAIAAMRAQHAADAMARANQLAAIEKRSAADKDRSDWEAGFSGQQGRIDGRSQRTVGMLGNTLVENGVEVNEAPAYRMLNTPDVANMLAPVARPQPAQQEERPNRSGEGGDGVSAAIEKFASRSGEAGGRTVAALQRMEQQVDAIDRKISSAAQAVNNRLGQVEQTVGMLQSQFKNARNR